MTPFTDGACRDSTPDTFFPNATDHAAIRAAKVICHSCPVLAECLELAMANEFGSKNARDGIYGGTTPSERAQMHKRAARPINHGTYGGYQTHRRRGVAVCKACATAMRAYEANRPAGRRRAA